MAEPGQREDTRRQRLHGAQLDRLRVLAMDDHQDHVTQARGTAERTNGYSEPEETADETAATALGTEV